MATARETLRDPALGEAPGSLSPPAFQLKGRRGARAYTRPLSTVRPSLDSQPCCAELLFPSDQRVSGSHTQSDSGLYIFYFFCIFIVQCFEVRGGEQKNLSLEKLNPLGASRAGLCPACAFGEIYFLACVGIVSAPCSALERNFKGCHPLRRPDFKLLSTGSASGCFSASRRVGRIILVAPTAAARPRGPASCVQHLPRTKLSPVWQVRQKEKKKKGLKILSDRKFLFTSFCLLLLFQ